MSGKGFWIGFAILAIVAWTVISIGANYIADQITDDNPEPVIVTE